MTIITLIHDLKLLPIFNEISFLLGRLAAKIGSYRRFCDFRTLEDFTETLSRNVGNKLLNHCASHPRRAKIPNVIQFVPEVTLYVSTVAVNRRLLK
jgi:hypothetical protein